MGRKRRFFGTRQEYMKEYYAKNREKLIEADRVRYLKNREAKLKYLHDYYEKNKERWT